MVGIMPISFSNISPEPVKLQYLLVSEQASTKI
jgi:hypothetical protein